MVSSGSPITANKKILWCFAPVRKNCQMDFVTIAIAQLLLTFHCIALPLQDSIVTDKSALLNFKKSVAIDPEDALGNWNETPHICDWNGVSCSQDRVIWLDLKGKHLQGAISPFLSNLSSLRLLDLSDNSFQGPIPSELGTLVSLEELSLRGNAVQEQVPESFGALINLRYIDLSKNYLKGQLPTSLFYNCTSLQYIDLSNNFFMGPIPLDIGNRLPSLENLYLYLNQLNSTIPTSLSNSSMMTELDLENNFLSGGLPSEIVRHMPMLKVLHLSNNHLTSDDGNTNLAPFFRAISNLTHLEELELAGNGLGGQLPSIIGLLHVNLSQIHLEDNLIHGVIPPNIANLSNLTLLNLSSNLLNGTIPSELSLLPKLERLCLSNNLLQGSIPSPLSKLSHLGLLDLSMNRLSNSIPTSLQNLTQLRQLLLNDNLLSGSIPPSLGKCVNLEVLDLSHNRLNGTIPAEVASLDSMSFYFNLSNNLLTGPVPLELSKMDKVRAIDLSSNNFNGEIPPTLGSCEEVELINLSRNDIQGTVPGTLGSLVNLKVLDLSSNLLSGDIPSSLQKCDSLIQLNISFNNFSGPIPTGGIFDTLTVDSFEGNPLLCGRLTRIPTCHSKKKTTLHSGTYLLSLVSVISTLAFVITICCVVAYKNIRRRSIFRRKEGLSSKSDPELRSKYPRITYRELVEATNGFEPSKLIGSGGYGRVYKGVLGDGTLVAVKVLQLQSGNSVKSFTRECRILKSIRHRNLTRIITACSLPDFKALVLPFMANGSLENHLYPGTQKPDSSDLSLMERVNICSDIAEGMAYLHHHSPIHVIHCDLKPSNILLNDDMTALVSDFGIARLVTAVGEVTLGVASSVNSTANLLCGSIGYVAPEYGMGRNASTKGDVYSFGVLVLEMVTRKRPTDDMFGGGLSLKRWVKSHYHGRLEKIIDSSLMQDFQDQSPEVKNMWEVAIIELLELGLLCTQDSPSTRPTMIDAADDLDRLKRYLGGDTTATFTSSLGISSSTATCGDW